MYLLERQSYRREGKRKKEKEKSLPIAVSFPQRAVMARTVLKSGPRASSKSPTVHVGCQTFGLFLAIFQGALQGAVLKMEQPRSQTGAHM